MKFELLAPAKINWSLFVTGKRPDGYHEIISPMQCVGIYDRLTFEDSDHMELESAMDFPPEENLVYKAARLIRKVSGCDRGVKIRLMKEIPLAAGLGGGSSDAAYALIGINRLWGLGMSDEDLMSLGAEIGSDVPFFIKGGLALIEGRGETVTPLPPPASCRLLLVKPPISVSAGWAYGRLGGNLTKKTFDIKLFRQSLDGKDFSALKQMIFNDLEAGVVEKYPVVGEIKSALLEKGAFVAAMSGSGPTVFGVFGSEEDAVSAAGAFNGFWCRAVSTVA